MSSYFVSAEGRDGLGSDEAAAGLDGDVAFDSAMRCAFSIISSCFDLSFARIGTRSLGTGVISLKFCENFIKSLSLIALSCVTR